MSAVEQRIVHGCISTSTIEVLSGINRSLTALSSVVRLSPKTKTVWNGSGGPHWLTLDASGHRAKER